MPNQLMLAGKNSHPLGRGVGMLLAVLVAMAVLTLVLALLAMQAGREITRQNDINAELPAMNAILVALLNAETGQRGYMLTHSRSYLEPYLDALKGLDAKLQALEAGGRSGIGRPQLGRLRELSRFKLEELTETIALHDAGRREEALALVMEGVGKQRMDELRALLGTEITRLGSERDALSVRLARDANLTMLVLLLALAGLAVFATLALQQVLMAARRLSSAERQIRSIADNLPVLITYLDDQLRLRSMNATFEKWLGIAPATVIGMPLKDVIGPTLFAQREEALARALAGEHVQFELCSTALGITRDLHNIYVPDVQADGRVVGVYVLTTDVSAMKQAQRQLAELARSDPLTGLPNRRQFDEALNHALVRARRDGSAVGLLYLDIDHFKSINDDLGHAAGDAVLKEFAQRLQSCVRASDLVARLAGDEFVVILVGLVEADHASAVAEKILHCMRKAVSVENLDVEVSTSIGVVVQGAGDVAAQELISRADQALYQAKRAGRNRYAQHQGDV